MGIQDYIAAAATLFFIVVGVGFFGWFKILKETNNLLKEQNAELKKSHQVLEDKYNESLKQAASMQGQIDILKSIPLVNIDTTLKQIADFNKQTSEAVKGLAGSNKEILQTLKSSAATLVKDTRAAASAAEDVRSELESSK